MRYLAVIRNYTYMYIDVILQKKRPIKGTLHFLHRDYRNNNTRCRRGKNSCGCDIGLYNQTRCNKFKEKLFLFLLNIAYFESYIVQLGTGCVVKLISIDKTLLALCLRLNVTCTCDSFTIKTVIIDNWPQRRISLQRNPAFCMIKFRNKERSRASSFILCYIIRPRLDTCASWYASSSEFLQRLCLLCMLKDALNFVPSTCEKNTRLLDIRTIISLSTRSTRRPHLRSIAPRRHCVSRSLTMVCPCLVPIHDCSVESSVDFHSYSTIFAPLPLRSFLYMLAILFLICCRKKAYYN